MKCPKIWYDDREPKLVGAFTELNNLLRKERQLKNAPSIWRRWPIALPFLIIGWGITSLPTGILFMPVGAIWIFIYWLIDLKRTDRAKNRRLAHTKKILRGEFGWAFMFEFEIVWTALNSALQAHELSLVAIFAKYQQNRLSQHLISEYLTTAANNRLAVLTAQDGAGICRACIGTQAEIAAVKIAQELQI